MSEKKYSFESIIGGSKQIQSAIELAKKVAPTDATVLLLGETGTGKDVFAQAIHSASTKASKTFLALNCSSFTNDCDKASLTSAGSNSFVFLVLDIFYLLINLVFKLFGTEVL